MKTLNKALLLCLLIIVSNNIYAQTKDSIDVSQFVVAYNYQWNTFDGKGTAVTDSIKLGVQVGTKVTKCRGFYQLMCSDFHEWKSNEYIELEWIDRTRNIPTWFINYPDGEMRTFDKVVPNRYIVEGKAPEIDWRLLPDTMTIVGYICYKAEGRYAGRKWIAWYTEDIPSAAGPWKLRGLPGLIMKAEDSDHIHSFSFIGLYVRQDPITYREPMQSTRMEQKTFVKSRNKIMCNKRYVEDPRYYIPQGALEGAREMWMGTLEPEDSEKFTTLGKDMIVPKKVNVYQPLELE